MSKLQLFIVPFAGGSSYSFKHIKALLEDHLEVHAWDGPGKGVNAGGVKNTRFDDEVRDFADYVREHSKGREYAAWGYSCGGLICYEAMRLIQADGLSLPKRVFLSAVRPAAEFVSPNVPSLDDDNLMIILNRMSGGDRSEELRERMGSIREDMILARDYIYKDTGKVNTPASVMYADDDEVTALGVSNWKDYFTGDVNFAAFHGKHFFYRHQPKELAGFILKELELR